MFVVFGKGKVGDGLSNLLMTLNISFVSMDDSDMDLDILNQSKYIIASPGIKLNHHIYTTYTDKILSELNFLAKFIIPKISFKYSNTYIGITATNGKSTTTWIIYNILKGLFPKENIWITGNFGIPLSQVFCDIIQNNQNNQNHIFVIESSSFMLYNLKDFYFDYGLFLNLASDHLDRHYDIEDYKNAKTNILRNAKKCGITSNLLYNDLEGDLKSKVKIYEESYNLDNTQFLGKHNQANLSVSELLMKQYFLDNHIDWNQDVFDNVLSTIEPLDHRLKLVLDNHNIKIYDDSICTSSQALGVALDAFDHKLLLVMGGYDKGEDYSWLKDLFIQKVGFVVLMGQIVPKIKKLCEESNIDYIVFDNLDESILYAYNNIGKLNLNTILYSPAAASFDMFTNVYHRIEEFEKIIQKLNP